MGNLKTCSVEGCDKPNKARGFCIKHYARWYKFGDVNYVTSMAGKNNPGYKHGKYCESSLCECGKEKDVRAERCSVCSGTGFPVGNKDADYSKYNISNSDIINAIRESKDFTKTAELLGVSRGWLMKKVYEIDNIDVSHFNFGRGRPTTNNEIFCENSKATINTARKRFKDLNIVDYVCSNCQMPPLWDNKPITLEFHHKDGNSKNHSLNNICWLCPNCHSQTDTNKGKNSRKNK